MYMYSLLFLLLQITDKCIFLTVNLEIEGLWYHIYGKGWMKSFYLSDSKFVDCLRGDEVFLLKKIQSSLLSGNG
jgi:hypothetical protein